MEGRNKKTIIILAVVVLLVALLAGKYLWLSQKTERVGDTVYKRVDLNKSTSKLPEGLPEGLPVETDMVEESYSSQRDGKGAELIAYTYLSTKSPREVYDEYHSYIVSNAYRITSQSVGTEMDEVLALEGTKDGNDLSIVIADAGGAARVQISYLRR